MKQPVHILYAGVRKVYGKKYDWWELTEPAMIPLLVGGPSGGSVKVPAGYTSDFASAPRWVPDWLIPRNGLAAMPSLAHDYLCEFGLVPRHKADIIFLRLMDQAGVPGWQQWLMYSYVRALGWIRYKKTGAW